MTAPTDETLRRWSERVGRALVAANATVATAESCTGGWIAKTLTDVPGSSAWFQTGYVTYANAAKTAMPDAIAAMAVATRRDSAVLAQLLADALPQIVDELTPDGVLPAPAPGLWSRVRALWRGQR